MGKSERHDIELARVLRTASSNQGIFTVESGSAAGLSKSAIGRLVDAGVLERVAPGHVRAAHLPWTLEARQLQSLEARLYAR